MDTNASAPLSHITVAGATGLIGRALVARLAEHTRRITVLTRHPDAARRVFSSMVACRPWFTPDEGHLAASLAGSTAIINLAGEGIASRRWTAAVKQRIAESRVAATRKLVDAIGDMHPRPRVLVNASAVGYYGPRDTTPCDETTPAGTGFLAETCRRWEAEADRAAELGVRVVRVRIGVVLDPAEGALARMLPPFRMGVGGVLGSGRQGFSWVHVRDVTGILLQAAANEAFHGAINATAPAPCNNITLARTLGRVLRRPTVFPVPAFVLRIALGDMADELLLRGQFVLPQRAGELGYEFAFPELEPALRDLLG